MVQGKQSGASRIIFYVSLIVLVLVFMLPLAIILMNSFKGRLFISDDLFALVNSESFVGFSNYELGFTRMDYFGAFGTSLFITVASTVFIVLFTSMTAWYLVRIKNKITSILYYLFVFAMVVPFQMVMYTMSWMSTTLNLGNPVGIVILYVGFGSGLSIFMFSGFVKSVPVEVEEASVIDGCAPLQTFFKIVFPIMRSTTITVAILNVMWIWNDYLLPSLVLNSDYQTLPIAIQKIFTGSYGGQDIGGLMAMLVLSILPIIIFYVFSQRYIIEGVVSGAVKG